MVSQKTAFFTIILMLFPSVLGEFVPRTTGFLEADVSISSSISSDLKLEELNYSIYGPQAYDSLSTTIKNIRIKDEYGNEKIILQWYGFTKGSFSIDAKIRNSARFSEVKTLKFPYTAPKGFSQYIAPSDKIVITDEIREKAQEITKGSENAFEAAAKLSHWVFTNIDYKIEFGNDLYGSDWVYENKQGTCDEFSNLLIALLRSVGIPARYSAGIVYSKGGWGYHAWVEAYLDEWMPIDPTWDEIGWLDAGHIPMGSFVDGSEVLVEARYKATTKANVEITGIPKVDVVVKDTKELPKVFSVTSETFPKTIGKGRASVIEATVKKSGKGCLASSSEIASRIDDSGEKIVSFEGGDKHLIALCGGEEKKIHFILKSREDLEDGFVFSKLADIKTFLGDSITPETEIDTSTKSSGGIFLHIDRSEAGKGERIAFQVQGNDYRTFSSLPIDGDEIIASKGGEHYIIAIDKAGNMMKKDLKVIEELPFKVTNIDYPKEAVCGQAFNVSFSVTGKGKVDIHGEGSEEITISSYPQAEPPANIFLEARVSEKCSGKEQFLSFDVGGQKYYLRIKEKVPQSVLGAGSSAVVFFFQSLLKSLKTFISSLLG